ncbi:hypothetical protein KY330_00165 [Candidatus Woesearchaeota archaeon]|nr:hypothetical protein [Candidatus Woesearchaeota archaeon]
MEIDKYLNNVVNTTVGSIIQKPEPQICKKRRSIQRIKDEAYDLIDIEEAITEFKNSYKLKLAEYSSKIKQAPFSEKTMINKALTNLNYLTKEIAMKQLINSNIEGLTSYLARLKVTILTKDVKVSKKIFYKFTKQKDMNILFLMKEIDDLNVKLDELEKTYLKFIDIVNCVSENLEHRVLLTHEGVHTIDKIRDCVVKQKELIYHVGKLFCEVSRQLLNDKECRKMLKQVSILEK